jgi:MFS family permease
MSVTPILPAIKDDLGGLAWYGWVFAAFALAQILAIPITGQWVDRTNPATPLIAGIVSFVAGLLVAAFAQSMPMLVGGRVLQGFGAGVVPAVAYVCVGRGFEEADRPRVFALMSTAWVVPSVVGPAAASLITDHVGWRWVFGGLVPVTIIAGGLAIRPLPRSVGRRLTPSGGTTRAPPARR